MRLQQITARLLVVLFVFGTSTPWHAADLADRDTALVLHDASAHQVHAESATGAPDHCAICHWLQSLRTVTIGQAAIAPGVDGADLTRRQRSSHPFRVAVVHLPARAPPA